ncbi:GNAT family N-acetyltransferase [Mycolicibacterium psychrotolerans]|uniref:N-acetyltransferase n=1 Tax=Mycolicibacterium psychrotolerans TaxID=216929 RepID=A0A7I7MHK7_9MYCO|nr:GNAT family N-acetyltransferase [Mycolicibacterium psychrotolerans]BBX70729.1 N-acetyltransferase [Mycolicibacterium psychrotolerans]
MERGLSLQIGAADAARVTELADVAARTFPLACPPSCTPADVAAFIAENLTPARFGAYLDDPDRTVLTATRDDRIIGYAMMIRDVPDDPDVAAAVALRPTVELSKMYVLPDAHGAGVSTALMSAALQYARAQAAASVWLGVNQKNLRAQRFYAKYGFTVTGTKTFRLGTHLEADYVMVRPV